MKQSDLKHFEEMVKTFASLVKQRIANDLKPLEERLATLEKLAAQDGGKQ